MRHLLRTISFFFALTIANVFPAQTVNTFHVTYDLDAIYSYGGLTNVIATADGGYLFPSMVNGATFDSVNLYVIKTFPDGSPEWKRKLPRSSRLWYYSTNASSSHVIGSLFVLRPITM